MSSIRHGWRFGDIVIRDLVGLPMIVIDDSHLDDGSGANSFLFFNDPAYRKIGSVYENPDLLIPLLEARGRAFDTEAYGFVERQGGRSDD